MSCFTKLITLVLLFVITSFKMNKQTKLRYFYVLNNQSFFCKYLYLKRKMPTRITFSKSKGGQLLKMIVMCFHDKPCSTSNFSLVNISNISGTWNITYISRQFLEIFGIHGNFCFLNKHIWLCNGEYEAYQCMSIEVEQKTNDHLFYPRILL